jgi:subtilisin family serine protease
MLNRKMRFIPQKELETSEVIAALDEVIDWGLLATGIPDIWQDTQGENINVAILDTGIADHIDLEDAIIAKYDTTGNDAPGLHGSHVAGIVAARKNDMGIIGVAPQSKLFSIKVLNQNGIGTIASIIKGLEICTSLDCHIINMSLGVPKKPSDDLHNIIKKLYSQGKFIIAAAGNNAGAVNYPAAYPEVIAVAAMDPSLTLAKFASRGPQVSALAPGVDIYSTSLNNEYRKMSGSSQAAPFFSGICALLLSYARKYPEKLQITTFEDMLKILDDLCNPQGQTNYAGKLQDVGYGIPHFANNLPWRNNVPN